MNTNRKTQSFSFAYSPANHAARVMLFLTPAAVEEDAEDDEDLPEQKKLISFNHIPRPVAQSPMISLKDTFKIKRRICFPLHLFHYLRKLPEVR